MMSSIFMKGPRLKPKHINITYNDLFEIYWDKLSNTKWREREWQSAAAAIAS